MSTEGWRFNSIGYGMFLVVTPAGLIRMMPLDVKDLARIIKEAAVQFEVEIREGRACE